MDLCSDHAGGAEEHAEAGAADDGQLLRRCVCVGGAEVAAPGRVAQRRGRRRCWERRISSRGEWDILANGEAMQEMDHIAKGQHHGNAVSLLRPNVSTTTALLLTSIFTAVFTVAINESSL